MLEYEPIIVGAMEKLYCNDGVLIGERKVHEQTVTFRLAHYLALALEGRRDGMAVDCEYHTDSVGASGRKEIELGGKTKRIRPDIIYHNRGERNDFCIELKLKGKRKDWEKIIGLVNEYSYGEGYCISDIKKKGFTLRGISGRVHREVLKKYIFADGAFAWEQKT